MAISRLQLLSLPVADQPRARELHVDVVGFELADTEMGPGRRRVQVRSAGSWTSITLVPWFETMRPGSTTGTVLESGDLDGDVDRLREKGMAIEGEVEAAPWGRIATFDDPDGNGPVLPETVAPTTR